MKDYLFLFRGGDMGKLSPEESQKDMQKWDDWIKGIAAAGKFKGGEPLGKETKVISGPKKIVTDGPFAESKELIGGYLIVTAENIEEAAEIAKGCPIYALNGVTEVREIHHMDF